jgi:chromosome segregation ATPase
LQLRIKELLNELEDNRRSQSESENEQIKSLSSKLTALEAQREEAMTKSSALERTQNELQTVLKSKEQEMDAQGRDLEQAYQDMSEREREWGEEKEKLHKIIEDMREEVVNESDRIRAENEEVEQRAR